MNMLTNSDYKEVILAYAACDMTLKATAEKIRLSYNTVIYRLNKIKQRTGLDPWHFYDLVKLVERASSDTLEVVNEFAPKGVG